MAKGDSDFYEIPRSTRYNIMLYYSILLVTGNDVMPSQLNEFLFCSLILVIGAFFEAYIIGGITAELSKTNNKKNQLQNDIEYVKFSMEKKIFPQYYRNIVMQYMVKLEESGALGKDLDEIKILVNPAIKYEVFNQYYYDTMKSFWMFS